MSYRIFDTSPLDPVAQPLIDALKQEYATRYRDFRADSDASAAAELARYPAELFAPPEGAFIVVERDGETVGGGAFKRYDAQTAELKRIWTREDQRRQGLARRVVEELESRARLLGYRRVYLTTGFKQPEAWGLYIDSGYTALFDRAIAPEVHVHLPFAKDLVTPHAIDTLHDLRPREPLGAQH
ncbi:acetyltransferase (GNAT) family protein [Paraburkholderia eburnea]|uniref:Acetyltransferase (GNAT) family protein n=1 Tax=Paraburkholderia eburnea TaxID=1189126 RepID=A0A2S4LYI2_9BURK|nr:GNAT family N-acetyltransferase [Paraburkholderia eburnea]POR47520.1 acetyltransferase (GNAT) family protein [Paraburkholderia eburnea]PRZ19108.1 acetyltransferase (GNAT) family protein [Paraburkholderia eburnea]